MTGGGASGGKLQLLTNQVTGVNGDYRLCRYSAFSLRRNQRASIQFISETGPTWVFNVCARVTGTTGNGDGYIAQFNSGSEWRLVRLDDDVETEIKSPAAYSFAANDRFGIACISNQIIAYKNGAELGRVTDANHIAGQGALGIFMQEGELILDNWLIEDLQDYVEPQPQINRRYSGRRGRIFLGEHRWH